MRATAFLWPVSVRLALSPSLSARLYIHISIAIGRRVSPCWGFVAMTQRRNNSKQIAFGGSWCHVYEIPIESIKFTIYFISSIKVTI